MLAVLPIGLIEFDEVVSFSDIKLHGMDDVHGLSPPFHVEGGTMNSCFTDPVYAAKDFHIHTIAQGDMPQA